LTADRGIVLIFDEVMTGFRVARGGAQERYGVTPDLTALGKIVGGGMPLAAYGGKREIMEKIAPLGPVYQAGTLSGNPVGVAAGMTTLRLIERDSPYDLLEQQSAKLGEGLVEAAKSAGIPVTINRVGSMLTTFFGSHEVWNYDDAKACDLERFAHWHREMLARGVYFPPSQFEACFVSTTHGDAIIEATLESAAGALAEVAGTP
jgi:glutamate-1-semialdehyde 2,1-aminomutase